MASLLNISEAASLGLHTMALLATDRERRFTNQEIADVLKASANHLAKVMQRLSKAGLVRSIRGPQGGFVLGAPAEQVALLQIYEAIEGPVDRSGCLFSAPVCHGKNCVLGEALQSIHEQLRDHLHRTMLADLAGGLGFLDSAKGAEGRT